MKQPHKPSRCLLVGIAGGSGSGKSTFVARLEAALRPLGTSSLQHDWYYRDLSGLPEEERTGTNFDCPEALETELLVRQILELKAGRTVVAPVYDFSTHTRKAETLLVSPSEIVLVEGILLFACSELASQFDLKLFIDTDSELRLARRIERDRRERGRSAEGIIAQFASTVAPMHDRYVEPTRDLADLVIPWNRADQRQIERVAAEILRRKDRL